MEYINSWKRTTNSESTFIAKNRNDTVVTKSDSRYVLPSPHDAYILDVAVAEVRFLPEAVPADEVDSDFLATIGSAELAESLHSTCEDPKLTCLT